MEPQEPKDDYGSDLSDDTVEQAYLKIDELLSYAREESYENTIIMDDEENTLKFDEPEQTQLMKNPTEKQRYTLDEEISKSPDTWFEDHFIMKLPEHEREEVREWNRKHYPRTKNSSSGKSVEKIKSFK